MIEVRAGEVRAGDKRKQKQNNAAPSLSESPQSGKDNRTYGINLLLRFWG